jgi:hypothetical protein
MRFLRSSSPLVVAILLLISCAGPKTTTSSTTTGSNKYSEDLSLWRPKVEAAPDKTTPVQDNTRKQTPYVEAKYSVNKKLDAVLDSIDRINLQRNFIDGFTIQVYSGLKREDALNTKKELTSTLPDLISEVQYSQPNFRVKVGKYFSRLDAQKDYVEVKRHFPTAIIIPDKVAIN